MFSKSSIGKIIDQRLSKKIEDQKTTHKQGNKLRKQFSQNVQEILQDLAEHTNANRALVFEFSNGTSNLVGLPFLFMSAAAEVVTPGTALIGQMYQRMNTSIVANFLADLEDKGFVYVPDLSTAPEEHKVLTYFMLPNDVKSALFCSIQGIDEAIGFLVITTAMPSEKSINICKALPLLRKASQKIGSMLNFEFLTGEEDKKKKENKTK